MSITHLKVSGAANTDPDKVGGEDWDAPHVVSLADADIPATIARDAEVTSSISTHAGLTDAHHAQSHTQADHTGTGSTSTQAFGDAAAAGTGTKPANIDHKHAMMANPVTAHEAAADPHTGYVREVDANWVDLTDGGATTLHTHAGGSGAPTDVDYLVGTASAALSAEIVVGTTPGGELGGTWASPTVDATHAGGTHLTLGTAPSTQAFADAAAGGSATDAAKTDHKHAMPTLGFGLTGNSAPAVSLTTASAFTTATTSVSAATYADVTGASISLAAGTWLVLGRATGSSVNAQAIMHVAITDGANAIIAEGSQGIGASGTANVAQLGTLSLIAIVTPAGTTTYKLRAARGLTTITGTWVCMDGAGTNTTNNLTDNSDKGTSIFAVRIA